MRQLADAAADALKELGAAALILILARDDGGPGGLVLAAVALLATFVISRWRWPYKPCSSCKATGRNKDQQPPSRRLQTLRRQPPCAAARGAHRPPGPPHHPQPHHEREVINMCDTCPTHIPGPGEVALRARPGGRRCPDQARPPGPVLGSRRADAAVRGVGPVRLVDDRHRGPGRRAVSRWPGVRAGAAPPGRARPARTDARDAGQAGRPRLRPIPAPGSRPGPRCPARCGGSWPADGSPQPW